MRKLITLLMILSGWAVSAQTSPEMADRMREEGKIYVVIAVIALIFLAIVLFLFYLERRVSRIEKKSGSSPDNK